MIKGFPTRIASICTVLFLLALLIPLTESWEYNVIEATCSIGSIITTDGTNDPDIMLGCDLEDVMYGEADNDVLQGRFDDDALYGDSGDDIYKVVKEEMNCMLEEEMMLFSQDLMMTF
jgi:RTX calcium-binding nonapeptide repeat (4 copies)